MARKSRSVKRIHRGRSVHRGAAVVGEDELGALYLSYLHFNVLPNSARWGVLSEGVDIGGSVHFRSSAGYGIKK